MGSFWPLFRNQIITAGNILSEFLAVQILVVHVRRYLSTSNAEIVHFLNEHFDDRVGLLQAYERRRRLASLFA